MKNFFTGAGIFAAALHIAPALSQTPPAIQGNWASPDCAAATTGVIFSKHYYLEVGPGRAGFWPVHVVGKGQDYEVLAFNGADRALQRTEDSLLRIGTMGSVPYRSWPKTWAALPVATRDEYTGCAEPAKPIPAPLLRVMQNAEALHDVCMTDITPACEKLLFKMADANANGKISSAEFQKAGATLAVFAAVAGNDFTGMIEDVYAAGAAEGLKAGDVLLARMDKDKSGDLSTTELQGFMAKLPLAALRDALGKTGRIWPAFSMSALDIPSE
jgi:EF hand